MASPVAGTKYHGRAPKNLLRSWAPSRTTHTIWVMTRVPLMRLAAHRSSSSVRRRPIQCWLERRFAAD